MTNLLCYYDNYIMQINFFMKNKAVLNCQRSAFIQNHSIHAFESCITQLVN